MIAGAGYLLKLKRRGVPVYWSHVAVEAIGQRDAEGLLLAGLLRKAGSQGEDGGGREEKRSKNHDDDQAC